MLKSSEEERPALASLESKLTRLDIFRPFHCGRTRTNFLDISSVKGRDTQLCEIGLGAFGIDCYENSILGCACGLGSQPKARTDKRDAFVAQPVFTFRRRCRLGLQLILMTFGLGKRKCTRNADRRVCSCSLGQLPVEKDLLGTGVRGHDSLGGASIPMEPLNASRLFRSACLGKARCRVRE